MPAILPSSAWDLWLAPDERDAERLKALLRPFPGELMEAFAVSRHVNDPRNDDPLCVAAV
jgi:putative SOS response-associated peptidase YedK